MGFNEDSFRRQGSSRLEIILILMSLGLLILLAFPIYNSVKGSGFVSDYPDEGQEITLDSNVVSRNK